MRAPQSPELAPGVLIVDADAGGRGALEEAVNRHGFPVTTAAGLDEALRAVEQAAPQVVLVVDQSPGVDGLSLSRALRDQGAESEIVAITASPSSKRVIEFLREGTAEVIRRPAEPGAVAAAVVRAARLAKGRVRSHRARAGSASRRSGVHRVSTVGAPALPPTLAGLYEDVRAGRVEIPAVPAIVGELRALLRSPRATMADVGRLIERDQSLAVQVLRLANTARYARGPRILDVSTAVGRVGFRQIELLIETVHLSGCFQPRLPAFQSALGDIWQHSVSMAVGMRLLVETTGTGNLADPNTAYLAGLLCDVGASLLVWLIGERAPDLPESAWQPFVRERHEAVGAQMLTKWNFDPLITQLCGSHHAPGPPVTAGLYWPLAAVAAELADGAAAGGDVTRPFVRSSATVARCLDQLRVTPALLRSIEDQLREELAGVLAAVP